MLKPNKKRIKLWYNALMRAQNQTISCLKDNNGRCCLGVACDVFKNNTGRGKWIKDNGNGMVFVLDKEKRGSYLPERVAKWFGFESNDPYLDDIHAASVLNDDELLTFKEIAKKIREKFLD